MGLYIYGQSSSMWNDNALKLLYHTYYLHSWFSKFYFVNSAVATLELIYGICISILIFLPVHGLCRFQFLLIPACMYFNATFLCWSNVDVYSYIYTMICLGNYVLPKHKNIYTCSLGHEAHEKMETRWYIKNSKVKHQILHAGKIVSVLNNHYILAPVVVQRSILLF